MFSRFTAVLVMAGLAALTMTSTAHAGLANEYSESVYTGTGVTQVKADFSNLDEAYNLEAVGGYWLTPVTSVGRFAAELNISITVAPGRNQRQPSGGGIFGGGTTASGRTTQSQDDLAMQNLGIFGVWHTPGAFGGRLYGIGVAGYSLINTSIQEISDRGNSAFSYGGGIGFKFGAETAGIELIYSKISEDLQGIGLRLTY